MNRLQPSSLDCFVCGVHNEHGLHIRFYNTNPGEVSAEVNIPGAYQSYPGVIHGGIIASMLDEVATRVFFSESRMVVTAKMEIRYRKPAPLNTPLKLVGRALQDKGRVCKALGQLLTIDNLLLAEAEIMMIEVSPEYLAQMTLFDQQGWQIYPEDYETTRKEER